MAKRYSNVTMPEPAGRALGHVPGDVRRGIQKCFTREWESDPSHQHPFALFAANAWLVPAARRQWARAAGEIWSRSTDDFTEARAAWDRAAGAAAAVHADARAFLEAQSPEGDAALREYVRPEVDEQRRKCPGLTDCHALEDRTIVETLLERARRDGRSIDDTAAVIIAEAQRRSSRVTDPPGVPYEPARFAALRAQIGHAGNQRREQTETERRFHD